MRMRQLAVAGTTAFAVVLGLPLLALGTLDAERYRAVIEEGVERATGHRLVLDGPIELTVSLTPELVATGVRVSNPAWSDGSDWLVADRVEARVGLRELLDGALELRRIALVRPRLMLETDASGQGNWALSGGTEETTSSGLDFRLDSVDLEGLSVSYVDGASGASHAGSVDALRVRAAGEHLAFMAEGRYGARTVKARGKVGRLRDLLQGVPYPIAVALEMDGTRGTFEGALDGSAVAGKLVATLDDIGEWFGEEVVRLANGPAAELDAVVRLDETGLGLDGLVLAAGDLRASGDLEAALGEARPRLSGSLALDRLDLDRLGGAAPAAPPAGRVFPRAPIRLSGLRALDAEVELRVGKLTWRETTLREVSGRVALAGGRLSAEKLRAGFLGSRARGALVLDASKKVPAFDLELSLARVPVRRLLERVQPEPFMEGLVDVELDLAARGKSLAALMANLDGEARVLMGEGRVRARRAESMVAGLSGLFGPSAEDDEWTPLTCAAADLAVASGQVTPNVLVLDTERATLVGEGAVDLDEEALALKLTPYPKSFTVNLAVPFHVRGTLADPRFAADEMAVARRVGMVALMAFPPGAIASLGTLAIAGAATIGMGGAVAHDSEHPCLALMSPEPARLASLPAGGEKTEPAGWAPGAMVESATIGAVEH